jgi:short-subunit dehydrogenase
MKKQFGEDIVTTLSVDIGDRISLYQKLEAIKDLPIDILINNA